MRTRWGCQRQYQTKCSLWSCCRKGILLRTGVECTQWEVDLAINGSCTMQSLLCFRYPPFKPHVALISRLPFTIYTLYKATGGDCQRAERSGFSKSWDGASTWDRCLRSLATARIRVSGWLLLYSKALLFYICFFITDFYTGEASLRQRYGDGR